MKNKLTLALVGLSLTVFAQNSQPKGTAINNIDVSNINASIVTGGDMFHDLTPIGNFPNFNQSFEVPKGSGMHTIFGGALWIGAKDSNNNLYVSSQTYRQPSLVGYWPGPIANIHDLAHSNKYDKVWKISKAEIDKHKIFYTSSFYNVPASIASWPGNGNTANGEAAQLAPYIDRNNDGIYNPNQGDYPDIKGDQALYVILNDKGNVKEPISPSMNAEIHVMYYGFDNAANNPVYNTLFSEYRIINRGQINLKDFYAGLWIDFDLGNYDDDFVGCDTTTNRFYVYNGDNFDEDSVVTYGGLPSNPSQIIIPVNGYGANPPVQSVAFLDQKMSHFVYYNNNGNAANGNPTVANDYYNYLRGVWRNNWLLTYGGDGTNQANPPANHMFSGDPVTATGWSERNTLSPIPNVPADRRGVGSIGPFNLNAGQELKFTVAYNYSRGTSNLNSVTQSQADAIAVQNFFRNQIMSAPKPIPAKNGLALFPNPAQDQIYLQLPSAFMHKNIEVSVSDYTGRTVLQKSLKAENNLQNLNIETLSKGIYLVSVTSDKHTINSRLVKL